MSGQLCAVAALILLCSWCRSLERFIHMYLPTIDAPIGLGLDRAVMLLYQHISQQSPWIQPRWLTAAVPGPAAACGNFILCHVCFRHVFWPSEENNRAITERWRVLGSVLSFFFTCAQLAYRLAWCLAPVPTAARN